MLLENFVYYALMMWDAELDQIVVEVDNRIVAAAGEDSVACSVDVDIDTGDVAVVVVEIELVDFAEQEDLENLSVEIELVDFVDQEDLENLSVEIDFVDFADFVDQEDLENLSSCTETEIDANCQRIQKDDMTYSVVNHGDGLLPNPEIHH